MTAKTTGLRITFRKVKRIRGSLGDRWEIRVDGSKVGSLQARPQPHHYWTVNGVTFNSAAAKLAFETIESARADAVSRIRAAKGFS